MKKIYIFLIYFIFCKYINASEVKLIIWSPEYVCIYNNLINEDDYKKVINNVICPFNTKIEGFYTKDSLENIIFMEYPVMSKFIIYIGSEISDNSTLEYNTEILRKYSQKNIFLLNTILDIHTLKVMIQQ